MPSSNSPVYTLATEPGLWHLSTLYYLDQKIGQIRKEYSWFYREYTIRLLDPVQGVLIEGSMSQNGAWNQVQYIINFGQALIYMTGISCLSFEG